VKRNFCQVKRSFLPVSCIRIPAKERCKELSIYMTAQIYLCYGVAPAILDRW